MKSNKIPLPYKIEVQEDVIEMENIPKNIIYMWVKRFKIGDCSRCGTFR